MIGLPLGLYPIGGNAPFPAPSPAPNIFLYGTLYSGPSRNIANRITTFLNFGVVTNDDNVIQVSLNNRITGQPITIKSGIINIYLPNTDSMPVITKTVQVVNGSFQFGLTRTDISSLLPGLYAWIAIVTLADGTQHTVICGDRNLTTGIMKVVERP